MVTTRARRGQFLSTVQRRKLQTRITLPTVLQASTAGPHRIEPTRVM